VEVKSLYDFKEHTGASHTGEHYYSDDKWLYINFELEGWHCFNRYYISHRDKYWCEILPFLFHKDRYCVKLYDWLKGVYK
jgi:hypothetical protein